VIHATLLIKCCKSALVLPWIAIIACVCCSPNSTGSIGLGKRTVTGDTPSLADPIWESRIQITADSFEIEYSALRALDSLAQFAIRRMLDSIGVANSDRAVDLPRATTKPILDSMIAKLNKHNYKNFQLAGRIPFTGGRKLLLIPYIIWTRTTREFESERCYYGGYKYYGNPNCTWTQCHAYLFLIDNETRQLVYYRSSNWATRNTLAV
jgi:hypothetical protein